MHRVLVHQGLLGEDLIGDGEKLKNQTRNRADDIEMQYLVPVGGPVNHPDVTIAGQACVTPVGSPVGSAFNVMGSGMV